MDEEFYKDDIQPEGCCVGFEQEIKHKGKRRYVIKPKKEGVRVARGVSTATLFISYVITQPELYKDARGKELKIITQDNNYICKGICEYVGLFNSGTCKYHNIGNSIPIMHSIINPFEKIDE